MNREVPLLLACLALPALAQQVRFEVPRLGYVYDAEAKAVRAVSGVPGAAVLEGTVSQGSLDRAWVSSLGFAVAQAKQGGSARLLNFETGTDTVLGDVQSAALSGRFAAVANRSSLEIWDAQSASRTTRLDLSGVRAVAVSPDGQQALATNGTTLQRIAGDTATSIWSGDNIIGVAYIDGGYVAFDAARNKLLIARGGETSETDGPLTGAIAFAALDGAKLAFGNDTAIAVLDLAGGAVRTVATEHPIEELLPASNGVAQIRFRGNGRVALLEWNADQSTAQIEYLVAAGGAR